MSRLATGYILLTVWFALAPVLAEAQDRKAKQGDQLLVQEFSEFTRLLLGDFSQVQAWLEKHAPARVQTWREAANGGSPEAMVLLGACLEDGKGLPPNEVEGVKWIRKAAELGNAWGQGWLGLMYDMG
jgi:TPR repeat protein